MNWLASTTSATCTTSAGWSTRSGGPSGTPSINDRPDWRRDHETKQRNAALIVKCVPLYDARQKYDVLNAQCTMKFILVYLWSSFEECEKFVTVQSSMAILNYEPRYPAVNQGFRKQRPGSSTRQRGSFRSWMTWVLWMTIKLQQVFFPKLTNPSDTRLALVALGVRKAPPPLHRSRELHGRGVRGLHRLRLGVR